MKALLRKILPLSAFSCIVSIGTLLLYNIPFFQFVIDKGNESEVSVVWLVASLVVIMLAVNFMMTYLVMFCLRMVGRILLAIPIAGWLLGIRLLSLCLTLLFIPVCGHLLPYKLFFSE